MTQDNTDNGDGIALESIDGVTWTDDDGQRYHRVIEDGEVRDIPAGHRRHPSLDHWTK